MQGNGGVYAVKRRRKPVQKNVKTPPVKTNPSKRHRDRLNIELDRLTGMLPFSEEVRGRLDKLSVLRLSVGYLKLQSYFHAVLRKNARSSPLMPANGRNGQTVSLDGVGFSEGELLLQALNGFVLVVTTDGTIFYSSPTIRDFLGFHQSDVFHQSVYDLVHVDDRETFKCQLHFALNPSKADADMIAEGGQSSSQNFLPQYLPPENSSFLERSFCCRVRCLLDNTSGFLALNFSGRLKYLHFQGNVGADGTVVHPQLALFAIATPVQSPSVMEIRTKTFIFQTKHRMDFAPMSIDTRGKLVLGYTEVELVTPGSGYQFVHAADMMYCADNHLRMMKTVDSGFTIFRLLTKTKQWLWVQAQARVVFKKGRPDFIIARQKALTNEEGEEQLRQRRQQLPFNLATGEGVLYDVSLDPLSIPGSPDTGTPGTSEPTAEKPLDPASIMGSLHRQDRSLYTQPENPSPQLPFFSQTEDIDFEQPQPSLEQAFLDSHALLSVPAQSQTLQKRSSPADLASEAMIESLEQILGDIGDGGIEGLEVEETELREWEKTLIRMNKERENTSDDLNHILANDVFSYVEEALRRETDGPAVQASGQTGCPVSGMISSLSIQGEHPGLSHNVPQWQPVTDMESNQTGFEGEARLGNIPGGVGRYRLKSASQAVVQGTPSTLTPSQCRITQQGHSSSLWPPISSNHHCGNEMMSTQTHLSWLPSTQNTNTIHSRLQSGLEVMDQSEHYSLNHSGSQQTSEELRPQDPAEWQQQRQLSQSFHHRTLSHSSHTPGSVNSTAHPRTQRLSGSCMYEKREGHIPNSATVLSRPNGPLLGPACTRGATHAAGTTTNASTFTLSHLGINQGMMSGPSTDVGNISMGHLSGHDAHVGTHRPEYRAENGLLQSSFFCWNSEAQIPNGSLNGVVDQFAFPVIPDGTINLSQNTGL
ncbi:aryl hydrocarbon receptor [Pleuronectes platessa]|uniref:aryl hydrocarbon receptor n=1 Tax=Pleuronectes platessa TaxID=8262 RepID=UPI00232A5779|nr:aryl hydrocarbon receptor [Pleuronectes platessa]